ncbi:hypothetical protein GCM10009593_32160 [Microlunatus antarcticus]
MLEERAEDEGAGQVDRERAQRQAEDVRHGEPDGPAREGAHRTPDEDEAHQPHLQVRRTGLGHVPQASGRCASSG